MEEEIIRYFSSICTRYSEQNIVKVYYEKISEKDYQICVGRLASNLEKNLANPLIIINTTRTKK